MPVSVRNRNAITDVVYRRSTPRLFPPEKGRAAGGNGALFIGETAIATRSLIPTNAAPPGYSSRRFNPASFVSVLHAESAGKRPSALFFEEIVVVKNEEIAKSEARREQKRFVNVLEIESGLIISVDRLWLF